MPDSDYRAIVCNFKDGTSAVPGGALCYVLQISGDGDRLRLLARARDGRWIERWESLANLENFRPRTVPPESPLYDRVTEYDEEALRRLAPL